MKPLVLVLVLALVPACGGSKVAVAEHDVTVMIVPPFRSLPFDPGSARIALATRQLEEILHHPVVVEIDQALLAPPESAEQRIAQTIESAASDIASIQKRRPAVFAEARTLERIEIRYDAVESDAKFDGSVLVVRERASDWGRLLGSYTVSEALADHYRLGLEQLFQRREPEQIPPGERAAYADYMIEYGSHIAAGRQIPPDPRDQNPWLLGIERIIRLSRLIGSSDPPTSKKLRAWLLDQTSPLGQLDTRPEPPSTRVGRPSAEPPARGAWIAWLNEALPSFTPEERLALVRSLTGLRGNPFGDRFDLFAFGVTVVDDWIRAGHPSTEGAGPDPRVVLQDMLLCPPRLLGGELTRGTGCYSIWLNVALATDANTKRLADLLDARGDPQLLYAVVAGLHYAALVERRDVRVALLQALETHPRTWRLVMLQLIDAAMQRDGCDEGLVAEANRVWRDLPVLRGTALHVLACKSAHWGVEYSQRTFAEFPKLYGTNVDQAVFASFLEDGPSTLKLVPHVWPALGKGWSRAAPVASKVGPFLQLPDVRAGKNGEPDRTLRAIAERLCADKRPDEAGRLYDAISARAKADATEAQLLSNLLIDMKGRRCPLKR